MNLDEQKNNNEHKLKEIKSKLEEISKTSKELENYLSLNTRFKTLLTEFIHSYLLNNDQSLCKYYSQIKETIRTIEMNNKIFVEPIRREMGINSNEKDFFNLYLDDKNNEIIEQFKKLEMNYKFNPLYLFQPSLENQKDEILKDFLKEDYVLNFKSNHNKLINSLHFQNFNPNEIPRVLIEEINKRLFANLKIEKDERRRLIIITIKNSFIILLEYSDIFNNTFKFSVHGYEELSNSFYFHHRKEYMFYNKINKRMKIQDRSCYKVFRKIGNLLEERFYFFSNKNQKNVAVGFYAFIMWLSNYNDLFKKKCYFCKKTACLNISEKCFFPPYYKFLEFDNDRFFHEECYTHFNNSFI